MSENEKRESEKRNTMRVGLCSIVVVAVLGGLGLGGFGHCLGLGGGGVAAAQPGPGSGSGPESGSGSATPGPTTNADADAALRDQCTGVIARSADHTDKAEVLADEARRTHQPVPDADATVKWTQAQIGVLWPLTKRYKADDLNAAAQASHDQAAAEVATNKRHVILAYAALWVLAAIFLVVLWRRQQGLKSQIAELKRDLDAAVKDAS